MPQQSPQRNRTWTLRRISWWLKLCVHPKLKATVYLPLNSPATSAAFKMSLASHRAEQEPFCYGHPSADVLRSNVHSRITQRWSKAISYAPYTRGTGARSCEAGSGENLRTKSSGRRNTREAPSCGHQPRTRASQLRGRSAAPTRNSAADPAPTMEPGSRQLAARSRSCAYQRVLTRPASVLSITIGISSVRIHSTGSMTR